MMKPGHTRRSSHGHYPIGDTLRHPVSNGHGSGSLPSRTGSTSSAYGTSVRRRSHRHRRRESKDLHDHVDTARVSAGGSEDLYVRVENVDDFWLGTFLVLDPADEVEIEEIVTVPSDADLVQLDGTLRMFVTFCAAYHGKLCIWQC